MSKDNITNYGKSIRSKLLNIAKKEDVFYQTILTRYFQERLLYRISQTRYRNNFYLKGGALMYAYERFEARPTLDIDFLDSNISNEGETIIAAFKVICSVPCEEDGITYDTDGITAQRTNLLCLISRKAERMAQQMAMAFILPMILKSQSLMVRG